MIKTLSDTDTSDYGSSILLGTRSGDHSEKAAAVHHRLALPHLPAVAGALVESLGQQASRTLKLKPRTRTSLVGCTQRHACSDAPQGLPEA